MSSLDRKYKSGGTGTGAMGALLALILGVPALMWVIVTLGAVFQPRDRQLPAGFYDRGLGVFKGDVPWRTAEWVVTGGLVLLLLAAVALLWARRSKKSSKRVLHDRAAQHMGSARDLRDFTLEGVKAKAKRFGVDSPGLFVGRMVRGGKAVYASWEDTMLHIWGTRTGKTTSQAAPTVVEAPGCVIATSNKRDLSDMTRDLRAEKGTVWVFDPQGVADEEPSWWWNPLSYVTDAERAAEMAENFALGSRSPNSRGGDAHFDSAGKDLLSALLLAAAVGKQPISKVHYWLTRSTDETPVGLLEDHGWNQEADSVMSVINQHEKYRGSVYSTALEMARCLKNRQIARWVNPDGAHDSRPQLDLEEFVTGTNTLYALSKEGAGTAGPLVTSLTVATVTAAEEFAVQHRGGRMPTPMVCVLDEAANVCRWANLPDLYSHYGSRGIVLSTFLQSWSQGVDVWGESGMKKLFSTANIVTYGGNVKEDGYLRMLNNLVGQFTYTSQSSSRQREGRSVSRQDSNDEILSVKDLGSMPKGRAVMFPAGAPAVLLRTVPISQRSYAKAVAASEAAHNVPGKRAVSTQGSGIGAGASSNRWDQLLKG